MSKEPGQQPLQDPNGPLESELINEFLRTRGYDLRSLDSLPDDERRRLLRQASMHAAGKLTEIEARAHFVGQLHGDTDMG
jgi:hypothetical protein